jgi:hypothetical protein
MPILLNKCAKGVVAVVVYWEAIALRFPSLLDEKAGT